MRLLERPLAIHVREDLDSADTSRMFLGHADLGTTKIYLRLVPGQLRRDYDRAMPDIYHIDDEFDWQRSPPPGGSLSGGTG